MTSSCHAAEPLPTKPRAARALDWCASVQTALGSSGVERGFECLRVPNFLVTGFYGTRKNPERSDFINGCFAGQANAAERLRMSVRPAGSLHFSYKSEQRVAASGGVDLRFMGPWAPELRAGSAHGDRVDVSVTLEDSEIRVLPSVPEILAQEYQASAREPSFSDLGTSSGVAGNAVEGAAQGVARGATQAEREDDAARLGSALEACLASLCERAGPEDELVYTAKVLAAVPVIRVRFRSARRANARVLLAGGVSGFEVDQQSSEQSEIVIRAKEKLNVAALLEVARPAFERAATCKLLGETRTRRQVTGGLRQLGLRTLAGRDLATVPAAAGELRTQIARTPQAFSTEEEGDLLRSTEALESASRALAASPPTRALCGTRSLVEALLRPSGEASRVRDLLIDVGQPLHRRLTELANEHGLPCADPAFYRDEDGDGYGDKRSALRAAKQPAGYVANGLDCFDQSRDAHPGQLKFFTRQRGDGNFDYDCDGRDTAASTLVAGGCKSITRFGIPIRCWAEAGWRNAVPACGQQGNWFSDCEEGTLSCDEAPDLAQRQSCR